MKKLLNCLLLILLVGCSNVDIAYFDTDYKKVFAVASRSNRMIFLDFSTVWCGPCQYFEKRFQPDSALMNFMNETFFTCKIDAEHEFNKEIVSKYNISAYPTFIITDSNGDEISRIVGLKEKAPTEFIDLLKNIIEGKEQIELLKKEFFVHPDSIDLFKKIIDDKLLSQELYGIADEFALKSITESHNEELKNTANFYIAYSELRNPAKHSPKKMATFVEDTRNEKRYIEWGLNELFFYYRSLNNSDSVCYYLNCLINLESSNHFAYVRDYARYLYKNHLDIGLADKLTKEYSETEGFYADHWTPYLKVHSLAQIGEFEKGIKQFDDWMAIYSKPENFTDDYWNYKFYIDLFLFYKKGSNKAIEYATMFEKSNPDSENKRDLAELYYLNGQVPDAVNKLTEVKNMTEDPKIKTEIDELIKKYNNRKIEK